MIGEIAVGGIYVPTLLLFGVIALLLTGLVSRLLGLIGAYRLVAYRPVADIALFVLILGGLVFVTASAGAGS